MIAIDGDVLWTIVDRASGARGDRQREIIEALDGVIAATLEEFGIDNRLRAAHFLAQVTHECGGFTVVEENLDYSARRLRAVWPGRFPTIASATPFAGNPRALGDKVYGGRLGNGPNEGYAYRGRGLIQLTGKDNYRQYGGDIGVDIVADPDRATEPVTALRLAGAYWRRRSVNPAADLDDVVGVTKKINGGTVGLPDRRARLARVKTELARLAALVLVSNGTGGANARPVLRRGSKGPAVEGLQRALGRKGYLLAIDQDFGPGTETVVRHFQQHAGLVPDGIVGPATWARL